MATRTLVLPDIGEGLVDAEVVEWLVKPGDEVVADQPVVSVETAKSIVELPAPCDGTVADLLVAAGETVSVGVALISFNVLAVEAEDGRFRASPAVRRRGVSMGIDLAAVVGTGPNGRVTSADLDRLGHTRGASVAPLSGLRRTIARSMTESWQTIPHITEFREVDATGLLGARRELDTSVSARVGLLGILARVVIDAVRRHPLMNSRLELDADRIVTPGSVDLGIAAATPDGLIVPIIRNADTLGLVQLTAEIHRLGEAARNRTLTPSETAHGTITITNFGSFGTWLGTPIIRPPESVVVGFGRIRDRVVAVNGVPVVRPTLPLAISADHRLIDGDQLGAFVNTIETLVTSPISPLGA